MVAAALIACLLAQVPGGDPTRAPATPPEPAPPRPSIDDAPPDAPDSLGVAARFAYRRASDGGTNLGPADGFSLGAVFQHRYATIGGGLELGLVADLFLDRFSTDIDSTASTASTTPDLGTASRLITETSFAALQTFGVSVPRAHLWLGLGPGLTVAYASSPPGDLSPVATSTSLLQPLARAAAAVEVTLRGRAALTLMGDYSHVFRTRDFQGYHPFGDFFDVGVGLLYRF